jgi:hypothetical protein
LLEIIVKEHQNSIEPLNILVGAGCINEPDYFRFKDSPTYSLYIDIFREKEQAEKQYHMYTINYEHLEHNFLRMKPNSINQIHFDTGVSYFAPIKYLELAEHILIPGGKIIWDLLQHGGMVIFRRDNKFKKLNGTDYAEEEITKIFNDDKLLIDTIEKKITPLNYDFFSTNTICPQIRISIVEFIKDKIEKYKLEPYIGFIEYCSHRFTRLNFHKKKYTFADYTYPVPIRIFQDSDHSDHSDDSLKINVYNPVVNFIVNEVMSLEERRNYIDTKKVSIEKIIQLCDRINISVDLKNKILELNLIPREILDLCKISDIPIDYDLSIILGDFIWNEFNINLEYIEATKK